MKSDLASQTRVLHELESGVDESQIEERLALSPTERLDRLRAYLLFLDELTARAKDAHGH